MNAVDKNSDREPVVRGVGNFPAYFILAAFVLAAVGFYLGSAVPAVIGVALLFGSVVGLERWVDDKKLHVEHRRWRNPNSVIRHA